MVFMRRDIEFQTLRWRHSIWNVMKLVPTGTILSDHVRRSLKILDHNHLEGRLYFYRHLVKKVSNLLYPKIGRSGYSHVEFYVAICFPTQS